MLTALALLATVLPYFPTILILIAIFAECIGIYCNQITTFAHLSGPDCDHIAYLATVLPYLPTVCARIAMIGNHTLISANWNGPYCNPIPTFASPIGS